MPRSIAQPSASLLILCFLSGVVSGSRVWGFLGKRALTPDNTCGNVGAGNRNGYVCNPALFEGGKCCSANGYCGNSEDYCGSGCQSAFGSCDSGSKSTDAYVCGSSNNGMSCAHNQCCSANGYAPQTGGSIRLKNRSYCGNETVYCGPGCQIAYGRCSSSVSGSATVSKTSSSSKIASGNSMVSASGKIGPTSSPGGGCGPQNGGYHCPNGQCCSPEGWCGTTEDYCADPDCQFAYGSCDSDHTPAGASTINDQRPLLGSVTYTQDIYDCIKPKVVALTFDDGPYLYTNALLDILQQFNFTATFFITGNNLGKGPIDTTAPYPTVIKRMIADGHQVASHTWSHYSLSNISSAMRIQQMTKNERAIANIIGKYPTYMRPPYSQCSQSSGCWADLLKLGYHRTYFDLDTQDYLNPLPSQIQNSKNIVKNFITGPGGSDAGDWLSIQHDIVQQSAMNLSSYYYSLIKSKGWKGVTVGECLNDPPKNWYRTPGATTSTSIPVSSVLRSSSSVQHQAATSPQMTISSRTTSSTMSSMGTTSSVRSSSLKHGTSSTIATALSSSDTAQASKSNQAAMSGSLPMSTTSIPISKSSSASDLSGLGQSSNTTRASGSNTSTSTSCSLTTGLSPDGQIAPMTIYHGSSFLPNSTQTELASFLSTATQPTTNVAMDSGVSTTGMSSIGRNSESNPTQPNPAIPTNAGFGYAYIGCFVDDQVYRVVSGVGYRNGVTVRECAEYCSNQTATSFAIEYYGECFCGQSMNTTRGRSEGCNYVCNYNNSEICGGFYAAQVYSQNISLASSASAPDASATGGSTIQSAGITASDVGSSTSFNASASSITLQTVSITPLVSLANASMSIGQSIGSTLMPTSSQTISSTQRTIPGHTTNFAAPSISTTYGMTSLGQIPPHLNSSSASGDSTPMSTNLTRMSSNNTLPTSNGSALFSTRAVSSMNTVTAASNFTASLTFKSISVSNSISAPSATLPCIVKMENFCGSIEPFDTVDACWNAVSNCTEQNVACYGVASGNTTSLCRNYTERCVSLFWYCQGCGSSCSSQAFLTSLTLSPNTSASAI